MGTCVDNCTIRACRCEDLAHDCLPSVIRSVEIGSAREGTEKGAHIIQAPGVEGVLRSQQCVEVVRPEVVAYVAEDRHPDVGLDPVALQQRLARLSGRLQPQRQQEAGRRGRHANQQVPQVRQVLQAIRGRSPWLSKDVDAGRQAAADRIIKTDCQVTWFSEFKLLTSYNLKGTRMHSAHSIQNGLYAKKKTSVQRLPASSASHMLRAGLGPAVV